MTKFDTKKISCRINYLGHRPDDCGGATQTLLEAHDRYLTLRIDDDERDETWETLVDNCEWGAFRDIEGFDPKDERIQKAVDDATRELSQERGRETTTQGIQK